jgi:predicted HTH transcriptional regulator
MIKKHQEKYYEAINICDHKWNSDLFIEFMLNMIDEELESVIVNGPKMNTELWWDWLSKNELIIIEYIKNNWKVWAKEIIEGTSLADSTTRRILKNLVKKKVLKTTSKIENDPTNKYELVGL